MKLLIAYTIFDGTELLEKNINHHLSISPDILLCWQRYSNTFHLIDEVDQDRINSFDHPKLEYLIDLDLTPKEQERRKHQMMINYARKNGFSHILLMACDEFYRVNDVKNIISDINEHDVAISLTQMFTYYKKPIWQLTPIELYWKPFIMRIDQNTRIISSDNYPVVVDPALRITNDGNFKMYPKSRIMMHHYSMIRDSIEKKIYNAALFRPEGKDKWIEEYHAFDGSGQIEYFKGRRVIEVDNYFDL